MDGFQGTIIFQTFPLPVYGSKVCHVVCIPSCTALTLAYEGLSAAEAQPDGPRSFPNITISWDLSGCKYFIY